MDVAGDDLQQIRVVIQPWRGWPSSAITDSPSRWARWPWRPGVPDRVRTYLLTFALVDDVAGIAVIALVYSGHIDLAALGAGVAILGVVVVARQRGVRNGAAYLLLGVAAWIAFFESGATSRRGRRWRWCLLAMIFPAASTIRNHSA